jgi:hypothetical protein
VERNGAPPYYVSQLEKAEQGKGNSNLKIKNAYFRFFLLLLTKQSHTELSSNYNTKHIDCEPCYPNMQQDPFEATCLNPQVPG